MKQWIHVCLLVISLTACGLLLSGCSHDDGDSEEVTDPRLQNPLAKAVKELNNDLSGLDFKELEPLSDAVNTPTRGLVDDVSEDVRNLVSQLLAVLHGDASAKVSGGRRFTYQTMNDALSVSFDLAGCLEINSEKDVSFLSKHTKGEGEVTFVAKDGSNYTVAGMTEKDVYIKSWKINVDKASELTIYKDDQLLLKLTASVERDRPVWMPLLIRGNTFVGELTYQDYIITMGYDRESTHHRNITLEYRKTDNPLPLIEMSTHLEDDANLLNLIKHDVTVEADFTAKALYGVVSLTGHCTNVNYLVVKGKEVVACLEKGTSDEASCRQMADEFNEYLTMKLGLGDAELGDLVMSSRYVDDEGCWKPALMIDSPMLGGRVVINDLLNSLGIDMSEVISKMAD